MKQNVNSLQACHGVCWLTPCLCCCASASARTLSLRRCCSATTFLPCRTCCAPPTRFVCLLLLAVEFGRAPAAAQTSTGTPPACNDRRSWTGHRMRHAGWRRGAWMRRGPAPQCRGTQCRCTSSWRRVAYRSVMCVGRVVASGAGDSAHAQRTQPFTACAHCTVPLPLVRACAPPQYGPAFRLLRNVHVPDTSSA